MDYRARFGQKCLNEGTKKRVNLRTMPWGEVFDPLRDPSYFAQARLTEWTVEWPNGADFAPEFLYAMEPETLPAM